MKEQSQACKYTVLLARLFLVATFLYAGYGKITGFAGQSSYAAGTVNFFNDQIAMIAIGVAIVIEVLGGLSVLVGYKARIGAWALAIFTIVATVLFHTDWFGAQMETIQVLKNLAIIGGLMLVGIYGSGPMSLDGGSKKKEAEPAQAQPEATGPAMNEQPQEGGQV